MSIPRNVLTIATGKKLYVDMAVNLARSFWLWNKDNNLYFYLATDQPEYLPVDVNVFTKIIQLKPGELGSGFSPKLHLDKLAPEGQTLFIDSDCLVYGNIAPVFEKFKGHAVSVVGNYISSGEWFGDVVAVCKKFNIKQMPKFNGGIYYLEKGGKATQVYQKARELEKQYDDIGFVRLRDRPNDEVLISLAMALNDQMPIPDNGDILGEFVNFQSGVKSDLLNGHAELYNNVNHKLYQKNWHLTNAKPLIVHYLGHHNQTLPYVKEAKQLQYLYSGKLSKNAARIFTFAVITLPFVSTTFFKNVFRPLYRLLFGTNNIKISERVINND